MEPELILIELWPFELSVYRVWSLCNQLLLQFSVDSYQKLYICWGHKKDVLVGF